MNFPCPACARRIRSQRTRRCPDCGCEVGVLAETIKSSHDSLMLAMLALREGRDRDAQEFALESWSLCRSRAASAAGLIAATIMRDPIEIARWMRRRRRLRESAA